jgi:hypothetical protein
MLFLRRRVPMTKRLPLVLAACLLACAALSGCFLFPNRPPVAVVVVHYNIDETDPMVVELDASASTDPDGNAITAYMWTFSDDFTIIEPLAFSTVVAYPRLRVRCPNEGQYTLELLVVDDQGLASDSPTGVTVTVPQPMP